MQREPAEGEDEDEAEDGFGNLPPLSGNDKLMELKKKRCRSSATFGPDLFEVLGESDAQAAVPVVEHLAGHQCVEDGCARQWHAEVEAEKPPVLCLNVKLRVKKKHELEAQFNIILQENKLYE